MARPAAPIAPSASRQPTGPAPQLTPMTSTSATPAERRARPPRRRPVRQREVLAERQQRDDRQVGGSGPRLLDRDRQVVDEREGLEPEQVGAALEEPVDGLAEAAPDRPLVEVQDLARRRAERPDGPGHEHVPAGDVARLACDLGATPREPARLVAQAVRARAGCGSRRTWTVSMMSAPAARYSRWIAPISSGPGGDQLVQHGALRDAAAEQQRAHRSVGQQRAGSQALAESVAVAHRLGLVRQVRREPPFRVGDRHALAPRVVLELVVPDPPEPEVVRWPGSRSSSPRPTPPATSRTTR